MKIQTLSRLGALAAVAAALSACGGGGSDAGCSVFATTCTSTGTTTGTGTTSDNGTVTTSAAGTVVLSLSSNTISASTPGTVTALVKKADGSPLANAVVTFAVTNNTATVSPLRVITDAQGNASATLQPVAGAVGADYVTAVADVSTAASLTTRTAFTVSAVNVTLGDASASPSTVAAYGASVITVPVVGASSASPVTVTFSSTCAAAGRAVLSPVSVTVTGTAASTTYQDKACGTTDRISASLTGTSQQKQIDLAVAMPTAQALEFVSASPEKICLAGSGCEEASVVKFRLKDQYNNPVAGREVGFALDIPNVAQLSTASYKTNEQGIAEVSVKALTLPGPVRVRAEVVLDGSTRLSTVSNVLAINAGRPTQRAFSFSAEAFNIDGWSRDGVSSLIRVQLSDRFSNPVPDGTSVSFIAEGASVIPARCTTVDGVCNVKFVSSNFRPDNGRVTVAAYAQGEESFDDQNGDNLYTSGEPFGDLGPVFIDKDESRDMAAQGEYIVGDAADKAWSANTLVRSHDGTGVFVLSDSSRAPRLFQVVNGACSGTPFVPQALMPRPTVESCRVSFAVCMRDGNINADAMGGNPIPATSTLAIATSAKGASVKVYGGPIPSTRVPTLHVIEAQLDDCTKAIEASGAVDLTVKMPAGETYPLTVGTIR